MNRFLTFLILIPFAVDGQTLVKGVIYDTGRNPIQLANIYLAGTYDGATSDTTGYFSFSTHEAGEARLVVSHLEFNGFSRLLTLGHDSVYIEIELEPSARQTDDVVIAAGSFSAGDKKKGVVLSKLDVLTTAGSDGDIYGALQTLPGTQTVGESGQLFVRGGAAYETRTFIDGLLVAQPYGTRLPDLPARGRFSPTLFSGTLFSTGAYSAEYGQALSSALILETEDLPAENVTSLSLMTVGVGAAHTQRWQNASAQVSMNYSNLKPYLSLVPQNTEWGAAPQGGDVMANLRWKTGPVGMLKVLALGSWSKAGMSRGSLDQVGTTESFEIRNRYATGMITWNGLVNNAWLVDAGVSVSRNEEPLQLDSASLQTNQTFYQARVTGKKSLSNQIYLKTGLSYWGSKDDQTFTPHGESGAEWGFGESLTAAFGEVDWQPMSSLAVRLGVRAEHSMVLNTVTLAPRFAVAYSVGEKGQVSLAGGRFFQNPQEPYLRLDQPLQSERADHLLINYQWQVERRTFRVEGYLKQYASLATSSQEFLLPGVTVGNEGAGFARGVDVFWRDRETFDLMDYWVSYSFLDTRRRYQHFEEDVVPTFASSHNLSVVAKRYIPRITSQVGLTYSFASPRPFHNPNLEGWNQGRTPAFHNLSLNVSYLTHLFDHFTVVYASVSNVLGQEQIFGYRYATQPNDDGVYASEAILPPARRFAFIGVFVSIGGTQF